MRSGSFLLAIAVVATGRRAGAIPVDDVPVDVRADTVELDARLKTLSLKGNVRVDAPPFFLESDELHLLRTPLGVDLEGCGRLGFCRCLGAPLSIRFDAATIAPPHDVIVRSPRLEFYRVPILWAPAFWLRSRGRPGLLAPELAYRGGDGVFTGVGAHVPWVYGDTANGVDIGAGAYLQGGTALRTTLRTPNTRTHLRWDHLRDDGVEVDARASVETGSGAALRWDVDALRGRRAVASTSAVEAAAKPYDRGAFEASMGGSGWTVASGVTSVAARGSPLGDLGAAGPYVALRNAGAAGEHLVYDATFDGGALREASSSLSYGRGDAGAAFVTHGGPLEFALRTRAGGAVVATERGDGVEGATSARASVGLPLERLRASSDPNDPWVHLLEPRLTVGVVGAKQGLVPLAPVRGAGPIEASAWVGEAGWSSHIGRWGPRIGVGLDSSVGVLGDAATPVPVARSRGDADFGLVGLFYDFARVEPFPFRGPRGGGVLRGGARVGRSDGLHVLARFTGRWGLDPVLVRALSEPAATPAAGFLSSRGWSGAARVGVPLGPSVLLTGGTDVDLTARELLALRSSVILRDRCDCLLLSGHASHRAGRDGVDLWVTLDVVPQAPRR